MSKDQFNHGNQTYDRVISGHAITLVVRSDQPPLFQVYATGKVGRINIQTCTDRNDAWKLCRQLRAAFLRGQSHPFAMIPVRNPKRPARRKGRQP